MTEAHEPKDLAAMVAALSNTERSIADHKDTIERSRKEVVALKAQAEALRSEIGVEMRRLGVTTRNRRTKADG